MDCLARLRGLNASGRKPGILESLVFELAEVEFGSAVLAGTSGEQA